MDLRNHAGAGASGVYVIDPDGYGGDDPFPVYCDMETDGGGWTLVGVEEPSSLDSQEKLKYLGWDYGTPEDLVNDETALIGTRLAGKYDGIRITWDTSKYIQFTTNTEIFTNGTIVNDSNFYPYLNAYVHIYIR